MISHTGWIGTVISICFKPGLFCLLSSFTQHNDNYSTRFSGAITLGSEHWYSAPYPGPWVWAVVMTNSFLDHSTTSTISSWFYLIYLIWYYNLSVKFLMWIVKQKIEEKTMTMLTPCMGSMSIRGPPAGVNVINKYKCSAIKLYWNKERLLDDASNVTSSSQSEWFISAQSSNVMLKPLYDIEFRRTREGKESHDPYSVTCSFRHSILYTSFCRCFYDHSAGWSQCDQIGQFIGL